MHKERLTAYLVRPKDSCQIAPPMYGHALSSGVGACEACEACEALQNFRCAYAVPPLGVGGGVGWYT